MSAQDDLNAAALAYAVSQGYTKPAPPPPPPPPSALFDGRAVTQGSCPVVTGTGSNVVNNPPNPFGVWTGSNPQNGGYTYMGTDIQVIDDPTGRWGKVFQVAPAAGHHNPYDPSPTPGTTSAQMSKSRPTGLGTTVWYSNAFQIVSPFTFPDWGTLDSYGYQTVLYDQCSIGVGASPASGGPKNAWTLTQDAGLVQNGKAQIQVIQGLKPVVLDAWADFVVGLHVAADNTGGIEVHYRPQGGTWSQVWSTTGVPTVEWTNTTGAPIVSASVLDKTGLYFGRWSGTNPGPTGKVLSRGTMRHASEADAVASLG